MLSSCPTHLGDAGSSFYYGCNVDCRGDIMKVETGLSHIGKPGLYTDLINQRIHYVGPCFQCFHSSKVCHSWKEMPFIHSVIYCVFFIAPLKYLMLYKVLAVQQRTEET